MENREYTVFNCNFILKLKSAVCGSGSVVNSGYLKVYRANRGFDRHDRIDGRSEGHGRLHH